MRITKKTAALVLVLLLVVAGGFWSWRHFGHFHEGEKAAQGAVEYTCPMHPFVVKDKPGSCPICAMELVKKVDGAQASAKEMEMLGHVSLSPTQMVMANVGTTEVKRLSLTRELNSVGIITFDQSRQGKVTAWVGGRLDRLYVDKVGDYVSKSRPVAEVYSPDLVAAQQEYLLAIRSREQLKKSPVSSISAGGDGLVSSARQRLKLLGVKDEQIAELEATGKAEIRLSIYTPLSGLVVEKMVQQGQYVETGTELFSIADLSVVWVEVEVYENEFQFVKLGQRVEITSQSYPDKTFSGRVSFIYPFLDPKTRTVKVRVEVRNPGLQLKPDMFVTARIHVPLGDSLAVPVSAVIDTGKRQVAWVEMQPGMFEPRDVKVGARSGDMIQILSGLKAGEKVASSGGYLIDSEAQLKGGAGGDHAGHGAAPDGKKPEAASPAPGAGHQGHGAPSQKDDMNMDDMKM